MSAINALSTWCLLMARCRFSASAYAVIISTKKPLPWQSLRIIVCCIPVPYQEDKSLQLIWRSAPAGSSAGAWSSNQLRVLLSSRSGDGRLLTTCLNQGVWLPLLWRHNERDGVSNHGRFDYLLNRLFRRRSKKTSKLRITGLCEGNSPETGEFPAQRPVTRKMFPFHDVIMHPWSRAILRNGMSGCVFPHLYTHPTKTYM